MKELKALLYIGIVAVVVAYLLQWSRDFRESHAYAHSEPEFITNPRIQTGSLRFWDTLTVSNKQQFLDMQWCANSIKVTSEVNILYSYEIGSDEVNYDVTSTIESIDTITTGFKLCASELPVFVPDMLVQIQDERIALTDNKEVDELSLKILHQYGIGIFMEERKTLQESYQFDP